MSKTKEEKEKPVFDIDVWISKNYGKDILKSGQSFLDAPIKVIPFAPRLNTITGGCPEGTWVSAAGPPKIGKTTSIMNLAARAQRPEYGEKRVFYFDIEGRFKKMNIQSTKGLNPEKFTLVSSEEGKILSAEDFLNIAFDIVKNVPRCF